MPSQYIPVLIVAIVAALFPLAALALFKRARALAQPVAEIIPANEIGGSSIDTVAGVVASTAGVDQDSVKFYIAGALFVIFAAAIGFLIPWSIQFSQLGAYGLVVMLTFLGVLMAGYAWLYQKGALDWK